MKRVREVIKKNCEKAGRLTAWVDPPPPQKRSGKCENFRLLLSTLDSDNIRLETNFTQKNVF